MLSNRVSFSLCRRHLARIVRRFAGDMAGATAIEYGLLLAGISLFILVTVFVIGDTLQIFFETMQTKLATMNS